MRGGKNQRTEHLVLPCGSGLSESCLLPGGSYPG